MTETNMENNKVINNEIMESDLIIEESTGERGNERISSMIDDRLNRGRKSPGLIQSIKDGQWKDWLLENLVFIIAFVVPVLIMILIYIIRDIYPFGEEMYLRSDMYHQYAPFYRELARKLSQGGSLFYSWNIGMGVNFISLAAYYLASPFNVILIFFNNEHVIEVMSALIIAKMGLASWSLTYYLSKKFDSKKAVLAVFGIFYATSSYYAAFSWNIMWLDCMWLLPLIVLGIERLVKENKSTLYCITLGLAIISNYYIAIMLCIFAVLYFVYTLCVTDAEFSPEYVIRKILRFGIFSLIAGGLAAFLVIPEYRTLMVTQSGKFDFDWKLDNYFSMFYMMSRSLIDVPAAIFEAHDPNLYCSVGVFLLLPLYWLNKQIPVKEKVGKMILLIIFLLSFNFNIPNYIWHGLHFPNSLPARESFIYIFLLLVIACEAVQDFEEYTQKQIYGVFGGAVALILVLEQMFGQDSETFTYKSFYLSILFLAIYMLLLFAYRKYVDGKGTVIIYLLFVAVVTESTVNLNETGISSTDRTYYVEDNAAIEKLVETAEEDADTPFFRIEKYNRRTKNDEAWHGYKGMSTFSSTSLKGVADFYTQLGFEESYNSYAFYGATPVTASLFSVKYVLGDDQRDESNTETQLAEEKTEGDKSVFLYKNTYTLPLGFMMNKGVNDNWNFDTNNPFTVQNSLMENACGVTDIFTPMDVTDTDEGVDVSSSKDADLYVSLVTKKIDTLTANIMEDGNVVSTKTFSSMDKPYIVHVGTVKAGQVVSISGTSDEDTDDGYGIQLYAYDFHVKTFEKAYNALNSEGLEVTDFSDTDIKGKVTAKESGTLFTSISYEKGWRAYVDGEEVETGSLKDGMLTIDVSQGTHEIEFKFVPDGFKLGLAISLVSLLLLIGYIVLTMMIKRGKIEPIQFHMLNRGSGSQKESLIGKRHNDGLGETNNEQQTREVTNLSGESFSTGDRAWDYDSPYDDQR